MQKPIAYMSHAELIAHSRENAERYEARATEHAAKGEADEAAKLREWAHRSREEADQQEAWAALRPQPTPATRRVWQWFAGEAEDYYYVGPCASRAEAIEKAERKWPGRTIHLIEARQDPVQLAKWISVDDMVERLHESLGNDLGGEDGESPAEDAWTDAQHRDLEASIERAVVEWQARHRIVVVPRTFSATRNAEVIPAAAAEPIPAPQFSAEERQAAFLEQEASRYEQDAPFLPGIPPETSGAAAGIEPSAS